MAHDDYDDAYKKINSTDDLLENSQEMSSRFEVIENSKERALTQSKQKNENPLLSLKKVMQENKRGSTDSTPKHNSNLKLAISVPKHDMV